VDLATQDGDLVPQHQQFNVLGAAVAGELHQHLQDLPQQQVDQRGVHDPDHGVRDDRRLAQNRTSSGRIEFASPTR
jgi:hypothetical protein